MYVPSDLSAIVVVEVICQRPENTKAASIRNFLSQKKLTEPL